MAITIISTPNQFMAAYNQVAYTVSSNNTAQPNFNFIVDVNETSGANNPLARLKYPVQPSSAQLQFDVGNVIKNYVSYDFFNATGTLYAPNLNSRIKHYLDFRELYDVSGIPTLSSVLISSPTTPSTSSFKWGGNTIFDFEDFSADAYYDLRVENHGFLNTQLSVGEKIIPSQNKILSFFDPNRVVERISLLTGAGYSFIFTPTTREYLYNINAGKFLLDTGGQSSTTGYVVRLIDGNDQVITQYIFDANSECSQYETVRLHWLNKNGAWDSFNFIKNSSRAIDIERKQFKAPLEIGYAKSDRLKQNYNTTITDRININTDWVSDEVSAMLEELATSPLIYLERSATDFIAVNIVNSNYEVKKYMTDRKLFNVSFDIEYTYNRYRQTL
jgi:hypothetical protein